MPQPLREFTAHFDYPQCLSERPTLATHVGIIVSMWAWVELKFALLLAQVLHTDAEAATAMCLAIKSEPARLAAAKAAAEVRLSSERLEQFWKLIERISATGSQRDNIVHCIWAIPENNPESIVRVDSRKLALWSSTSSSHFAWILGFDHGTQHDYGKVAKRLNEHVESCLEYKEGDFKDIETRIETLIIEIDQFRKKLTEESFGLQTSIASHPLPPSQAQDTNSP